MFNGNNYIIIKKKYYDNDTEFLKAMYIYISSDTKNNVIIEKLKKTYPKIKTLDTLNDIKTIQFGSTCKHVILSHGSYSAIIGYLSFFSDVYFCDVPNNYWCPMGMLKNKGFNGVIVKSATDKFNEMKKK